MATEVQLPDPVKAAPALADNLCWLLSRASHVLMTEFTAALEGEGISPRAHSVLVAADAGEHTQTELARTVGLDKTTMVATVDDLEAAGLAARVSSPTDRRARVINVTAAGRRKMAEADVVLGAVAEDVLAALDADERECFLQSLGKLTAGRLAEPVACAHSVRRRS